MKTLDAKHYLLDVILRRDEISSFEEYPFSLPAIVNLERITLHPAVTFLIGENGSGKSTLLEAIAIALRLNPEGGTRNHTHSTRASHSQLHQFIRLVRGIQRPRTSFFLRAESFFNTATAIEQYDALEYYGGRSLHEQSHGESFFALLTENFKGNGLYLLDEPEAALSPSRQMSMLTRMHDLVMQNSQFIIATHSPILMAYPDANIFMLSRDGIKKISYTETEHYRVTRDFLNNHKKSLEILLAD